MGRYDGIRCPVCGEAFIDKDDVVVCPVCGAPHHRTCYEAHGECAYIEKHATGEEWVRPPKETFDGNAPARCPRCGTINPAEGTYCELCGSPLDKTQMEDAGQKTTGAQSAHNPAMPPVFVMPFNPYTTPYGGLNPDESIDGVPVKDIAMFVGAGSYYYLPRFKEMSVSNKKVSWNWAAFFGNALYFCGRRMYMLGVLLIGIFLIRMIPTLMYHYHFLAANIDLIVSDPYAYFSASVPASAQYWAGIIQILNYVYWVCCVVLGIFANHLYKRHVFASIHHLKEQYGDTDQYGAALKKSGGLKTKLVVGLAIAAFAVSAIAAIAIQTFLLIPAMS
ncbi:MAG: RING finger protein [Acetanaerobacterium sp.]